MTYTVMTVCTGNICRSPMAEVVLAQALATAGLGQVAVRSTAVTGEEIGNPIDTRAQAVLREAGYVVPDRGAVRVSAADIATTDLALAMTAQHARALRQVGFPPEKVVLEAYRPAVQCVLASPAEMPGSTPDSKALAKDLKKLGFRFIGPTTAYAAMQAIGIVDDHLADCLTRLARPGGDE